MDALLIIDMQNGLFDASIPRYDAEGVIERINSVAEAIRITGGLVVFIQHDGKPGGVMEPGTSGWEILPTLNCADQDMVVRKRACDSFYETELEQILKENRIQQLIITGCATDFCVDTTVRAAVSRDYEIIVVEDGHTTADRSHLDAPAIIRHHNWVWKNLIHPHRRVKVIPAEKLMNKIHPHPET